MPKFLAYLLGFMTLGIFWVGHSTQFTFIKRTDRHLTWPNIFILLVISIFPFTTAFLSEYINVQICDRAVLAEHLSRGIGGLPPLELCLPRKTS
ncbi:MAG: TMEM175 family protein [Acidobacteriota bacterium]